MRASGWASETRSWSASPDGCGSSTACSPAACWSSSPSAGSAAVGAEWAFQGFGALGRAYETAMLATLLGLGIQVIFGSFFLALLTMPLRRGELPAAADSHAGDGAR